MGCDHFYYQLARTAVSVRADAETLRRIPLFEHCDPVPLQIIAFASERMTVGIREVLLTQGEPTDAAYLVLSGCLLLFVNGVAVGKAEPGSLLGETAMIGKVRSSLTASAEELSYVAKITRGTFIKVAEEYPEFGQRVLQALALRVQDLLSEFNEVRDLLSTARSFSDI